MGGAGRPDRVRPGQPLALAPRDAARRSTSRRPRARASSCACARGRVLDVVVDLRRGSPTFGEWEAVELDDEHSRQLWIPVGFGHGFCVLSETADFVYKCTAYYDPATEAGHPLRRPRRRHRVAAGHRAALLRARPHRADAGRDRRRAAVPVRAVSAPTAASPRARPARCTSATCARRCWRGCSRARPARASSCAWRTSTRAACAPASPSSSSRTCARSGSTGTATVEFQSHRRDALRRDAIERAARGRPRCTSASARGRRSATPRRRRTGRCPRAPTPAPACG